MFSWRRVFAALAAAAWLFNGENGVLAAPPKKAAATPATKKTEFIDPMQHYVFIVTPKSFPELIDKHRNKDGVAGLLFFNSGVEKHRSLIDKVVDVAAKELKGMVRIGGVDCAAHSDFCDQKKKETSSSKADAAADSDAAGAFFVVYPPNPIPAILQPDITKDKIISATLRFIPGNNVVTVNSANANDFAKAMVALPKVLLFSDKTAVPVMYKAIANSFKDRITCGFVTASESAVVTKYSVKKFPALVLLRGGKVEKYSGEMKFELIHDWLNVHAETFVKGGGFSSDTPMVESAKAWLDESVPQLTGASYRDICGNASHLCGILLTRGPAEFEDISIAEQIKTKWDDNDPKVKLMWLDVQREEEVAQLLGVTDDDTVYPSFAVLNPSKRLRFVSLESGVVASVDSINILLERIVSGTTFKRITATKLPFAPMKGATGSASAAAASSSSSSAPPQQQQQNDEL